MKRTQQTSRMIIGALTLLTIALLTFTGCKKDDETSPSSTKTILKYEIVSPAPTIPDSVLNFGIMNPYILYTYDYTPTSIKHVKGDFSFTVWTKEIDVTNLQKPFYAMLDTRSYVPVTTGSAKLNIYINGVLKAQATLPVRDIGLGDSIGVFDNYTGGTANYIIE